MQAKFFAETRARYYGGMPFSNPKEYRGLRTALEQAVAQEHVPKFIGDHFIDQYECSCGWVGPGYWDLESAAFRAWVEHVADKLGLIEQECVCGKKYLPAEEKACHKVVEA